MAHSHVGTGQLLSGHGGGDGEDDWPLPHHLADQRGKQVNCTLLSFSINIPGKNLLIDILEYLLEFKT